MLFATRNDTHDYGLIGIVNLHTACIKPEGLFRKSRRLLSQSKINSYFKDTESFVPHVVNGANSGLMYAHSSIRRSATRRMKFGMACIVHENLNQEVVAKNLLGLNIRKPFSLLL